MLTPVAIVPTARRGLINEYRASVRGGGRIRQFTKERWRETYFKNKIQKENGMRGSEDTLEQLRWQKTISSFRDFLAVPYDEG